MKSCESQEADLVGARKDLEEASNNVLIAMNKTAEMRRKLNKVKKQRKAEEAKSHAVIMAEVKSMQKQEAALSKAAKKKTTAKEKLVNAIQATPALLSSAKTSLSEMQEDL